MTNHYDKDITDQHMGPDVVAGTRPENDGGGVFSCVQYIPNLIDPFVSS